MTDLTPERRAEIELQIRADFTATDILSRTRLVGHGLDLLSHIDAQAAELRQVDNVLARRPALDDLPNRVDKISHAISTAGKVDAQAVEIERLRELCITEAAKWAARELQQMERAEVAEQELAERYEDDVPKHVAWDVLVKRTAELTRYKAVAEELIQVCDHAPPIELIRHIGLVCERARAALEDGE